MRQQRNRGFSLIELLVVIAIIAVLAGMLLPTVKLVKDSALATRCRSNLRQVGMAMYAYASESDGMLPPVQCLSPSTEWLSLISPYADADRYANNTPGWGSYSSSSVLRGCPKYTVINGPNRGFAMNNSLVSGGNLNAAVPLSKLTYPASRTLVSERAGDNALWGAFDLTRHNNRVNALMCDLHIESMNAAQAAKSVNSPQSF